MKHFLLLFLFFTGSLTGMAAPTIITGRFATKTPKSVTLRYCATVQDEMESNYTERRQDLIQGSDFRFVVEAGRPVELQLLADEEWLFYGKLLLPGDSLDLTFHEGGVTISGTAESYMKFQFDYDERFTNKDSLAAYHQAWEQPDALSFADYRNKILQARLQFFEGYFKDKAKAPELFGTTYRATEELRFMIDMFQLSWRYPVGQKALQQSTYRTYMKDMDLNDPAYRLSSYYTVLLRELPYSVWSTMKGNADKAIAAVLLQNQYLTRDSIARVYFKGAAYDEAVYLILKDQVSALSAQVGQPDFDRQYRAADSLMTIMGSRMGNKELYARAATRLRALKEARVAAADFSARDLQGNQVKLSDYKGKVVYIDFWATDCVPCIRQLPYIKKMKERYQDNPDIVLLYVSFDTDSTVLHKFLKRSSFSGNHWIDYKGFASEAATRYHITSLPRYVVVDKKGMLVTTTAPLPSKDPYTLLDQLLKE